MRPSSLSTRERDAQLAAAARALVQPVAPLALVPQTKADPVIVQPPRPRIVFMEVVRDDFSGEVTGLRPVYEGE